MNILSKLQTVGRGSYQPNFHVEVKGLDEIVELAVQGRAAEYALGETEAASPLRKIIVTLTTNLDGSYQLRARLEKENQAARMIVRLKQLQAQGFTTYPPHRKAVDTLTIGSATISLSSPALPSYTSMKLTLLPKGAAELSYHLDPSGLRREDINHSITAFANALEIVVNELCSRNGKPSIQKTLYLARGEQVNRIVPLHW